MSIHHKFIAFFNATPGVYLNNPSLNNSDVLVSYVETVTGTSVAQDADFINLVLANLGFIEAEDEDLWDTAYSALSDLVGVFGRAVAVNSAVDFFIKAGVDPTSPYFSPANRYVRKVAGSQLATEANSAEGNPEVLRDVFLASNELPMISGGILNDGTLTTPTIFSSDIPDDLNKVPLSAGVAGVEQTTFVTPPLTVLVQGISVNNSMKLDSINLTSAEKIEFGHARENTIHQSLVDLRSLTLKTTEKSLTMEVGRSYAKAEKLGPLFTLRATDSTLNVTDDLRVAPGWSAGANGKVHLINSNLIVGDDLRIGVRDDAQSNSDVPNTGYLEASKSVISVADDVRLAGHGGVGDMTLSATTVTVGDRLIAGELELERGTLSTYSSKLISQASLKVQSGSTINATAIDLANTRGSSATAVITNSTLNIEKLTVADLWHLDNEQSGIETGATATLTVTDSTLDFTKVTDSPRWTIGAGDLAIGVAVVTSSVVTGFARLMVGDDSADSATQTTGGVGSLILKDSTLTSRSSDTGTNFYAAAGRNGGVGELTLNNSKLNIISDAPLEGASDGFYYFGIHLGRSKSDLSVGDAYDGTLRLDNAAALKMINEGSGNGDLYLTVGYSGRGLLDLKNESSIEITSNNTGAIENGLYASNLTGSYGKWLIDNSTITVAGSAKHNVVQIGNRGSADATFQNGAVLRVATVGDGSNSGAVRIGDKGGSGTLLVNGVGSTVSGDAYTVLSIGSRPESQYQASGYDSNANAETYSGATGAVSLTNGGKIQFGVAGDGVADIFVGNGGSLTASADSTVVGDIQIIGTGSVSDNLLDQVI